MNIPYMDPMGCSANLYKLEWDQPFFCFFFVSLLRFCLRIGRFSSVVWCKMARSHVATELKDWTVGFSGSTYDLCPGRNLHREHLMDSF